MERKKYYDNVFQPLTDENLYTFYPKIRSACNRVINLDNKKPVINFASCDYLGVSNDERVKQAAIEAINLYGTNIGGSIMISGYTELHERLEIELESLYPGYSAILFTTSYLANLGAISFFTKKGDLILIDKLAHGSLYQGAKLSGADIKVYRHNDIEHLDQLISKYKNRKILIITDGLFSADGDVVKLKEIVDISSGYNIKIFVDDAHGVGVLGENGQGVIEISKTLGAVDFIVGTMSKSFGSSGGFLLVRDKTLVKYIRHLCQTHTSSRAISPGVAGASIASLQINKIEGKIRRSKLDKLARTMTIQLKKYNFDIQEPISAIIPIIFGSSINSGYVAKHLLEAGFLAAHFPPPYVEKNKSRLRLGITYNHTEDDIYQFVSALNHINDRLNNKKIKSQSQCVIC